MGKKDRMRIVYLTLFSIIILSPTAMTQQSDTPGILKLKVDLDSVYLFVNNDTVKQDSYGNALSPDSWFILKLNSGDFHIEFRRENHESIDTIMAVQPGIELSFEAHFLDADDKAPNTASDGVTLILASDPDSARIIIETLPDTVVAPREFNITAGDHSFKAVADGCDDLNHNMSIEPNNNISMNFILAFTQPPGLTAEDLGLEYVPIMPLKEEAEALRQREMFDNYAATFALIPLGQGILGRLLLGKENKAGANILIVAGASLTAGAYIMGRIIPKRKLEKIREYNEEAKRVNSEAKYHNEDVDSEVEEKNNELLENWILRNQDRGKVEITVE